MFLVGAAAYTYRPYRHLLKMWGKLNVVEKIQAVLFVPVIRVTGDVAKMMGYPVGVMWRMNRPFGLRDPKGLDHASGGG